VLNNLIGVTGTPGTGKKSAAPLVARKLKFRLLDLNKFAEQNGLVEDTQGAAEVDTGALRKSLLQKVKRRTVIFGHLLPEVYRKSELQFVAILRCNPSILRQRLLARRYNPTKLVENVEAELIGTFLDSCLRSFKAQLVHEYDTTSSTPEETAKSIVEDFKRGEEPKGPWIDWTLLYDSPDKLESLLSGGRTELAST
jgi:adenylate kinase